MNMSKLSRQVSPCEANKLKEKQVTEIDMEVFMILKAVKRAGQTISKWSYTIHLFGFCMDRLHDVVTHPDIVLVPMCC